MPSVKEIAAAIDEIAPFDTQQDWDNAGVLVDCGGVIDSVMVSLDITDEVVNEAEASSCQLIVAHHPVIFKPMTQIDYNDVLFRLVKKSISAICAHTNLDMAAGGVNDILAKIFGIAEPQLFAGVGRYGELKKETPARQLAESCAERFGAHVRLADAGKPIRTLAVVGGSGGGLLADALEAGVDCILTGEADHHDAIDAIHAGVSMVVAGHFSTEFPVVPVLADYLKKKFPVARIIISRRDRDPFTYIP